MAPIKLPYLSNAPSSTHQSERAASRRRRPLLSLSGVSFQAAGLASMPLVWRNSCSSPVWNISRMMSQPPTNSPFT